MWGGIAEVLRGRRVRSDSAKAGASSQKGSRQAHGPATFQSCQGKVDLTQGHP